LIIDYEGVTAAGNQVSSSVELGFELDLQQETKINILENLKEDCTMKLGEIERRCHSAFTQINQLCEPFEGLKFKEDKGFSFGEEESRDGCNCSIF